MNDPTDNQKRARKQYTRKRYRRSKGVARPMKKLHVLYEQILGNHFHNLNQRKLSVMRDIYEKLPENPQDLSPKFIADTFGDLKPAARELLNLRLRPVEEALGRQLVPRTAEQITQTSQNHPPYFEEVLTAVVTNLRATREKQNQSLLSYRNLKRTIANYLGVKLKNIGNTLMRYVTRQLIERGIISDWDEETQSTSKIYRVNPDKTRAESS